MNIQGERRSPSSAYADEDTETYQVLLRWILLATADGTERADAVRRVTEVLFGSGDYSSLQTEDIEIIENELPVANAAVGSNFIDPLVTTGIASSNGEARRLIEQHAVYVNGRAVNLDEMWQDSNFIGDSFAIVRKGKNSNIVVKKQN